MRAFGPCKPLLLLLGSSQRLADLGLPADPTSLCLSNTQAHKRWGKSHSEEGHTPAIAMWALKTWEE